MKLCGPGDTMRVDELLPSANQEALLTEADVRNNVPSDSFLNSIEKFLDDHGNEIKPPGGNVCWSIRQSFWSGGGAF